MVKSCLYYFGFVIFIVTFPISFPIAMYIDSKKKDDPNNVSSSQPPSISCENPVSIYELTNKYSEDPVNL
jgi:hypothetical protein